MSTSRVCLLSIPLAAERWLRCQPFPRGRCLSRRLPTLESNRRESRSEVTGEHYAITCLIMAKQRTVDKCKLCALVKELCDSHYLPKRLYAFLRAPQLQNPNPVMEVAGKLTQISVQYRGYVFCEKCEDLFNKEGEKWVLANIPHDYDAAFPLQDAINLLKPVFRGKDVVLRNVNGVSAFDIKQLVYFAMSIFWRGAVHEWKTKTGLVAPKVNLGTLEEPIREFLIGESPLPDDKKMVLTIDVWPYKKIHQVAYPPCVAHLQGCQRYWFYIPGLFFSLFLGSNIPRDLPLRNAAKGIIGVDTAAANSVVEFTKQGVKSRSGPKMEALNKEIATIRSKTPK